jgi:hypothetical protein
MPIRQSPHTTFPRRLSQCGVHKEGVIGGTVGPISLALSQFLALQAQIGAPIRQSPASQQGRTPHELASGLAGLKRSCSRVAARGGRSRGKNALTANRITASSGASQSSRLYCHLPSTLRRHVWPEGMFVQLPSIVRRGKNGGRHFSHGGSSLIGSGTAASKHPQRLLTQS